MGKSYKYVPPKPPMWFNLIWTGLLGLIAGFFTAKGHSNLMVPYALLGAIFLSFVSFLCIKPYLSEASVPR